MILFWNIVTLVFVRLPAALIILTLIFTGQVLIRMGHGAVHAAECLARFLDACCPIRFDWADRYWAREARAARKARLESLNRFNQVADVSGGD